MRLTDKQIEVVCKVAAGNPDGSLIDLDELLERLSYKPSKDSIHFSIRALVKHELVEKRGVEKRRGRQRGLLGVTVLGQHFAAANSPRPVSLVEPQE
jgi:hypothetical protein